MNIDNDYASNWGDVISGGSAGSLIGFLISLLIFIPLEWLTMEEMWFSLPPVGILIGAAVGSWIGYRSRRSLKESQG